MQPGDGRSNQTNSSQLSSLFLDVTVDDTIMEVQPVLPSFSLSFFSIQIIMVKWWPSPSPSRRRRMASIVSLASLLSLFLFILPRNVDAQQQNSTNSSLPVYNIGVLFPDPAAVRAQDPTLNDMIVASEVAIQMASNHIVKSNILPGKPLPPLAYPHAVLLTAGYQTKKMFESTLPVSFLTRTTWDRRHGQQ